MIRYLNQNGLRDSPDCLTRAPEGGCWLSSNPRGFDSPRAISTRLDKPSQIMGITPANMYSDPQLLNYNAGSNYCGFPNNAEITYYIDDSIAKPFFGPNFASSGSTVYEEDYTDPMGSWKPHYFYTQQCPQNVSRLSWINDSTFFRQDLMAKQIAKINQSRFENLY